MRVGLTSRVVSRGKSGLAAALLTAVLAMSAAMPQAGAVDDAYRPPAEPSYDAGQAYPPPTPETYEAYRPQGQPQ